MNKKQAMHQVQGVETAEEIIGVLTAISVVAKRMAQKLALLEQQISEKEGGKSNAETAISNDAD